MSRRALNISIYAVWPLVLGGCASAVGHSGIDSVKPALPKDVVDCQYLGDVHGLSPFYGVFAASALESAEIKAFERVRSMGGTHVVWTQSVSDQNGTVVHGSAYRCSR